jgi:hypothetical protein
MMEEIRKELRAGVIRMVERQEVKMLLRVFLIPKKSGEWRKILDCTPVNRYCRDVRFKMEDHRLLAQLLKPQMWAVSIDVKAAYHHVTVDPQLAPYLSFEYDMKYYQYIGMPFGIKMAPRVFSRIMHRCMVIVRQRWKLEVVQYMDDIWLGHMDQMYMIQVVPQVIQFLQMLGWVLNMEKSELVPKQVFRFLGWKWDSIRMTVCLSEEKCQSVRRLVKQWIQRVKRATWVSVKDLASLIGSLSATRLQYRSASLYLAELNSLKCKGVKESSWNGSVRMIRTALRDLYWWRNTLKLNISKCLVTPISQADVWTDASPTGWGAHARWMNYSNQICELLAHGAWTNEWSSNKRELVAVQRSLEYFSKVHQTKHLKHWLIHSDNSTTVYNINRCASAKSLVKPMRRLFVCLERLGMTVRAMHVKGVENEKADSLSRLSRAGEIGRAHV